MLNWVCVCVYVLLNNMSKVLLFTMLVTMFTIYACCALLHGLMILHYERSNTRKQNEVKKMSPPEWKQHVCGTTNGMIRLCAMRSLDWIKRTRTYRRGSSHNCFQLDDTTKTQTHGHDFYLITHNACNMSDCDTSDTSASDVCCFCLLSSS